jgi:hypothetical protein
MDGLRGASGKVGEVIVEPSSVVEEAKRMPGLEARFW